MKKGFFLLEALLACMLISLLVGSVVHHYAQWARSYKNAVARANGLAALMTLVEQPTTSSSESDTYIITKKKIPIDAPDGAQLLMPIIVCPSPQCVEITASLRGDAHDPVAISVIQGGIHAS